MTQPLSSVQAPPDFGNPISFLRTGNRSPAERRSLSPRLPRPERAVLKEHPTNLVQNTEADKFQAGMPPPGFRPRFELIQKNYPARSIPLRSDTPSLTSWNLRETIQSRYQKFLPLPGPLSPSRGLAMTMPVVLGFKPGINPCVRCCCEAVGQSQPRGRELRLAKPGENCWSQSNGPQLADPGSNR